MVTIGMFFEDVKRGGIAKVTVTYFDDFRALDDWWCQWSINLVNVTKITVELNQHAKAK